MNIPRLMRNLKDHETAGITEAVGAFVIGDRVHETGVEARTRAIYLFGLAVGFLIRTGVVDDDEARALATAVAVAKEKA